MTAGDRPGTTFPVARGSWTGHQALTHPHIPDHSGEAWDLVFQPKKDQTGSKKYLTLFGIDT